MKKAFFLLAAIIYNFSGFAQNVTGTVKDENGEPLPGVTVLVLGTSNGTTSDFDGNFTIESSVGDILRFSYLGMKTKEAPATSDKQMNIVLIEDASALDEVVITAFGVEKKQKSLGYSVTQVKAENLNLAG
ncbi:carboxypeptidase-like regulatory domain-containing protein [Cellulophaga baltica]|nr:carboxypeptidase-like regulatory domain-containing protein [Cellulophaga baltica]